MGPTAILVTVRPSISRVSGGPPTRTSPEYVTFKTYTERAWVPRPRRRIHPVAGRAQPREPREDTCPIRPPCARAATLRRVRGRDSRGPGRPGPRPDPAAAAHHRPAAG